MAFVFQEIDDTKDTTFNQLLGIDDAGQIAGYYGSGAAGHPNRGYVVSPPYASGDFDPENYPASAQTQVTGINDADLTVGFEVDAAGDSYGFIDDGGVFSIAVAPLAPNIGGVVTEQFLGANDLGQVAGFYAADAAGDDAAFIYNVHSGAFSAVSILGAVSVTATGINNEGYVSGFYTEDNQTFGFVNVNGKLIYLTGPAGAMDVQALGLNDAGAVVGSYVDSKGNTDGFVYNIATGAYTTIIEGNGAQTVVNGINDDGDLVGFYVDSAGNTNGMLLTPTVPTIHWIATSVDDIADPTFNQSLAINNAGTIAGYFGSGASAHPNQGYTVSSPYGQANFAPENYPGSVQTQVTGINNAGATVGFEIDAAGDSLGWVLENGRYSTAIDPSAVAAGGTINEQFLGINDLGQVAGFWTNSSGVSTGFIYNSNSNSFTDLDLDGTTALTATDINDSGEISGFFANGLGFLDDNGTVTTIEAHFGGSDAEVLGLNNNNLAVGSFVASNGATEGFVYTESTGKFAVYTSPGAVSGPSGQTVLNGVNDLNQVVGFYMDAAGDTRGLFLNP